MGKPVGSAARTAERRLPVVVMSRRDRISYQAGMARIPAHLDETLHGNSFVLVFPVQAGQTEQQSIFNMNLG